MVSQTLAQTAPAPTAPTGGASPSSTAPIKLLDEFRPIGGVGNSNQVFTEPLNQAFFTTPEQDIANGINPLLRHVGADPSQATDVYVVNELRNLLFAPLPGGNIDEIDLIAIDIQRERDAGLGTLNQTRTALGLAPYTSFSSLTNDSVLQQNLQSVYGSINNVDLFVGGLAEAHVSNARGWADVRSHHRRSIPEPT